MGKIRCPFCHEYVAEESFEVHKQQHLALCEDGQHTDYVTLPPEEREEGDLVGVPTVYVHQKCGDATGMPEEIVRSYLQNPYLYMADATFCTGCGAHVPLSECVWTETGENLQGYMDNLRAQKPELMPASLQVASAGESSDGPDRSALVFGGGCILGAIVISGCLIYSVVHNGRLPNDFEGIVGLGFFTFLTLLLLKTGISMIKAGYEGPETSDSG